MKSTLLIWLLLITFCDSAQSISPFTVNAGGNVNKTVDFSIGESASIAYFQTSSQFSLSSGFIQSFTPLVTGIVNRVFEGGEAIVLFPNPASDFVRLKGAITTSGFFQFHLIDQQGRILEIYPNTYYVNYIEKEINTAHLQEGTYFIRLIYSSPEGINQALSLKFIKINE